MLIENASHYHCSESGRPGGHPDTSPQNVHAALSEPCITGDHGKAIDRSLRNDHPVKRIAVVVRKTARLCHATRIYAQCLDQQIAAGLRKEVVYRAG